MFTENHFYGHAELLLAAARSSQRGIPHRVQHGWRTDAGFAPYVFKEPGPKIVWGRRTVEQGRRAAPGAQLTPIGAPFLYLPPLEPSARPTPRSLSLLALPFHGWEAGRVAEGYSLYARALSEFALKAGFLEVTVCLYWIEHADAALRAPFEAEGFEVISMGHRDKNPDFLKRQRLTLLEHSAITSNRVSTATFYALALGRPFFLWGPAQGLMGTDDESGEAYDRWQRETFPELTWERFDGRVPLGLAEEELGAEFIRGADELRELLLLTPRYAAARALLPVRRAGRRLTERLTARLTPARGGGQRG